MPDLIVLNLWMPVVHGLETIREIAKSAPGVKILVSASSLLNELRREALRRGAHGYVNKSRPITDLIDEVERLLT
jgi:two-component system invasion response regulator UvrY